MKKYKSINARKAANQRLAFLMTLGLLAVSTAVQAQGGEQALNAAADEVRTYFEPATTLMYAIGAVLGLIGGIKVYTKWNNGDTDTIKAASGWVGGALFLVMVATILTAFFG